MTFDDYLEFVALGVTKGKGIENEDEELYVRDLSQKNTPATAMVSFNLKKYGIDLRGDGQMVYVPLTTLSDMYSHVFGNHVIFNGEKIMLANFEKKPADIDAAFFKKPYETVERPADLAAYSYGEMCFVIDHFHGKPGRNAIDQTIQEKGLDMALNETVRKLLKSTKMNEYIFGLEYLGTMLADGSHTTISPIINSILIGAYDQNAIVALSTKFLVEFEDDYELEYFTVVKNIQRTDGSDMSAKKRKELLKTDTYAKVGNTMYCIFDDFGPADSEGWTAFYKGTGPKPHCD